eukprot:TRINITY_DN1113_c0_g1_i1.p1 TRINITY_DN1113_c0_g1~~TRINITY_DN1113_c0_g1_i1.p1  ORF type:complete len:373 (+),score=44.53 TRINITY_DN1113_c0_g1_i1:503-1621(+)
MLPRNGLTTSWFLVNAFCPVCCRCSLLSYVWLLSDARSDALREAVWEPLNHVLRDSHPSSTRLSALKTLFCMAALSYQPSAKEITDLVEKVVLPSVERVAKSLLEGSAEAPASDDNLQADHLCGLIKLLGCSLGFMEKLKLHEILDWCFDALLVLLEQHETMSVKVASAEAAVAALDLIQRYEELEWAKINPRELVSALHGVLRDEDWGTDDERFIWKRTVEELVSMVDSQDYVVELPFISAKGHSFVYSKDTLRADKSVLFKHRNKKGKAVTGWSDAICVTFIRDTLGYTFSELSHVGESETKVSDDLRTQDGFSTCFLAVLARHPAAESFAEHVRNLRQFGSTSRLSGTSKHAFHRHGSSKHDIVRDELS